MDVALAESVLELASVPLVVIDTGSDDARVLETPLMADELVALLARVADNVLDIDELVRLSSPQIVVLQMYAAT